MASAVNIVLYVRSQHVNNCYIRLKKIQHSLPPPINIINRL